MFKNKEGKLTNIVPIPMAKMSQVTSRTNLIKMVKNKDNIHDVIEQYNKMLRIAKIKKTVPRLGIKGKTFTKNPTL